MGTAYSNTGSDLDSTNLVSAFVESIRKLNEAEVSYNAANPTRVKNNVSMSASFDSKTFAISASLATLNSLDTTGRWVIDAKDYLGAPYSTFVPGTGESKSTDYPSLVLEIAQKLSAAEKTITPEADQPNNIQLAYDNETGVATITAEIPFTASFGTTGEVTLTALSYV
ncbi:hypothetical protein [Pseudanabaena sp. 'Roaring Creek']|uniref:hypothetical protein n=1 Tax=Pseudanabaena sp. 'Roaring Creek' TaxID=1681830 RepID=UPI0006D7836B|nr:hypothetical protein [Pseudanabaena sp. 'Roaring Creek']